MATNVPVIELAYPHSVRSFSTNRPVMTPYGTVRNADFVEVNGDRGIAVLRFSKDRTQADWSAELVLTQGENLLSFVAVRAYYVTGDETSANSNWISNSAEVILPVGVDPDSVVVYDANYTYFSKDRVTYKRNVDYTITGGLSDPLHISRLNGGTLANGAFVKVAYTGEYRSESVNLTVYLVNSRELSFRTFAPVSIQASNHSDRVVVRWAKPNDMRIDGFLVYASENAQGVRTGYTLLTKELVTTPTSLTEDFSQLSESLNIVRRLSDVVGEKIVDEHFERGDYWAFTPSSSGAHVGIFKLRNALLFSSGGVEDIAVYKLRNDFSRGTRLHVELGKTSNKVTDLCDDRPRRHGARCGFRTRPEGRGLQRMR